MTGEIEYENIQSLHTRLIYHLLTQISLIKLQSRNDRNSNSHFIWDSNDSARQSPPPLESAVREILKTKHDAGVLRKKAVALAIDPIT